MTSRKKDKASSDAFRRVRAEQTEGELAMLNRLRTSLRAFCEREGVAYSALHARLADGWPLREQVTRSSYRGRSAPKSETQVRAPSKAWAYNLVTGADDTIPKGDMLWALCERLQLNAEWLFTGHGSPDRETARAGGQLSEGALASELVAHVLPRCAELYGADAGQLEVHPEALLQTCVEQLLQRVEQDAVWTRRWLLLQQAGDLAFVTKHEGVGTMPPSVVSALEQMESLVMDASSTTLSGEWAPVVGISMKPIS